MPIFHHVRRFWPRGEGREAVTCAPNAIGARPAAARCQKLETGAFDWKRKSNICHFGQLFAQMTRESSGLSMVWQLGNLKRH
jgi:hypothetical protein